MTPPRALVPLALAVAGLAAGCGGGEGAGEPRQPPARGYGGGGAGVTVEEARQAGGTQLVRGFLVARNGETRLCSTLLESYPAQCGEPSLLVEGLDVDAVAGTTTAQSVTWSEGELSLHGALDGDVLRVSG